MLYVNFQSISLDDFDSGSFALALNHFDIALQQPQPPGFPVYIGMGHLTLALTGNPRAALTLLSAIMGSIAVGGLTWLGAQMGDWPTGLLAGLLLAFLPGFWLSAEMALSDVPGLALVLLAIAFLWRGRTDSRWLVTGAFLSGLCLGLRPQDGIAVGIFVVYAWVGHHQNGRRGIAFSVIAGLIGVGIWLIPTLIASGGLQSYIALVRLQSTHVFQIDSLFAQPVSVQSLIARLTAFGNGLLALVGGSLALAVVSLIVIGIGLWRVQWRTPAALLLGAWLIIVAVQVFLLESLERPRLYLPFIPPLLLLTALGWIRGYRAVTSSRLIHFQRIPVLCLAGAFGSVSLPLVAALSQQLTPPAQATTFIAAHYPSDKTMVVMMGSLRAAQIDLPAYPQLYLGEFNANDWTETMAARNPTYLILMDRDDVWPEAYDALTSAGEYVPVLDRTFQRDPRIFPQHSLIRLQVLTPADFLAPGELALPADGNIAVGAPDDGKYFGEGWYRAEDVAGSSARWTQQSAVIRVALPSKDIVMTLEATPYGDNQSVEIAVNGQPIRTLAISGIWQPISITIPASAIQGHAISTISLKHAHAETPPGSNRPLATAYRTIRFSF